MPPLLVHQLWGATDCTPAKVPVSHFRICRVGGSVSSQLSARSEPIAPPPTHPPTNLSCVHESGLPSKKFGASKLAGRESLASSLSDVLHCSFFSSSLELRDDPERDLTWALVSSSGIVLQAMPRNLHRHVLPCTVHIPHHNLRAADIAVNHLRKP